MSDKIEIQGKTVEAAVSEALLQMGARRDEVEIKVLEEPKSGFMGFLGGRAARVLVRKKRSGRSGGRSQDHRVDDGDYQAHNLGRGGGRGRSGSRRQSSGNTSKGRSDSGQASGQASGQTSRQPERDKKREEKSGSPRGSRGRRGRGRSQEASGRNQRQDQRQDQKPNQKQNQASGRRPAARPSRNGAGDSKQEGRTRASRERTRPTQGARPTQSAREDSAPREETPIRPLRQEPAQTQTTPVAPAASEETKPLTPKKENTVTKPPKPRRSFGGLGSRIREKRVSAKAAEAPSPAPEMSSSVSRPSTIDSAPVTQVQSTAPTGNSRSARPVPERMTRERRGPSFRSAQAGEELILGGIKGTQYAKPIGSVTEEGLDEALTELTDAMLARAGFPCRCETFPGEYRQIKVTTDEASAGMLIGRHGQTVEAVEHLVERMASNSIDARARINLDINNYRMHREEQLIERVSEAAEKIRETGRPMHMEPMSGRERRIVHMESEALGGLRTFTMDGSGGKHVVIALEDEGPQGTEGQRDESQEAENQEAENQEAENQEAENQEAENQEAESMADRKADGAEELNNSDT